MSRRRTAALGWRLICASSVAVLCFAAPATRAEVDAGGTFSVPPTAPAGTAPEPTPIDDGDRSPETTPTSEPLPATSAPAAEPADEDDGDDEDVRDSPGAAPSVRSSDIPLGSILIAVAVLVAGAIAVLLVRSRSRSDQERATTSGRTALEQAVPAATVRHDDAETLQFLLELGEALIAAGDAVGHVEATLRSVAEAHGIGRLGVLVLPSAVVLSLERGGSVTTEVSTGRAGVMRLDQVGDVLRLVEAAERREIGVADGRRRLAEILASAPPFERSVVLLGYAISSAGLALILRGDLLEVGVAALLGVVVGALRLATWSQPGDYQAFWPLVAASVTSTSTFALARAFDDMAVFPSLVSPLVVFLPGALLTVGVLELATGQMVSGASRLAAGALRLVLLAIGVVAGARLVGVPAGDVRGGTSGLLAEIAPWVGVAVFGVGISWFYGARRDVLVWILVVLYVAYAGQVVGGLFFGSALSAFFGALAMTPVAMYVARQPGGPPPLVTFLPGFWLLVPGALGLEGVTRIIGQEGGAADAILTTGTSMVAIALGVLLASIVTSGDPSRPWSSRRP